MYNVSKKGVEDIEYGAFYNCPNVRKVKLPKSVRSLEKSAFGAIIIGGEGIIAHEMPQDDDIEQCKDIGRQLAEL